MATFSLTVPVAQPSPLVPNRRDLTVTQGDDVTLQFTINDTDTGSSHPDFTGAAARFRLFPVGHGTSDLEVDATVVDAVTGRIDVALTDAQTADLSGEYHWQLRWAIGTAYSTICEGAFLVRPEAPNP